jgi:hypothetical protein
LFVYIDCRPKNFKIGEIQTKTGEIQIKIGFPGFVENKIFMAFPDFYLDFPFARCEL